jgi:thiol-disulfide isomerase/thioredoxin
MKGFGLVLLFLFTGWAGARSQQVTLRAEIEGCGPMLRLFVFDGNFKELQRAKLENNAYVFKIEASKEPRFYYIGQVEANAAPFLAGTEPELTIRGSCGMMKGVTMPGSKVNAEYNALKVEMDRHKAQTADFMRQLQRAAGDYTKFQSLNEELKKLDDRRLAMLDSLKKVNPLFSRILALNTYLSFNNYGNEYEDEIAYFANEYFKYADLKDEAYNYLPWVYESFKSYTMTLSGIGLPDETHRKYIEAAMWKIPKGSPTHKMALSGVISILKQRSHANYLPFAEAYIEAFASKDPASAASMQQEIQQLKAFMTGGVAPEFSQPDTSGVDLKLSDLRGKVLLVDFWASWCGPCRRENPNVVQMYNKYKDKGFDILGVSLDSNRDKWLDAIAKDGLIWRHVSDLKGWSNAVAQQYGVNSIPHTILLDREGKIIARGLRGPALEQKLAEIFR